jgi:type II secretory pathway component PulF
MPSYNYAARDRTGKSVRGTLSGLDERAVREQLRRKDLYVTEISAQKQAAGSSAG